MARQRRTETPVLSFVFFIIAERAAIFKPCAAALLVFVIFWILGKFVWITFIYAVTVELILFLVLHSVWGGGAHNYFIIGALVASAIISIYFSVFVFAHENPWQLFLLLIPGELIVFLSSRIKKKPKTET